MKAFIEKMKTDYAVKVTLLDLIDAIKAKDRYVKSVMVNSGEPFKEGAIRAKYDELFGKEEKFRRIAEELDSDAYTLFKQERRARMVKQWDRQEKKREREKEREKEEYKENMEWRERLFVVEAEMKEYVEVNKYEELLYGRR